MDQIVKDRRDGPEDEQEPFGARDERRYSDGPGVAPTDQRNLTQGSGAKVRFLKEDAQAEAAGQHFDQDINIFVEKMRAEVKRNRQKKSSLTRNGASRTHGHASQKPYSTAVS